MRRLAITLLFIGHCTSGSEDNVRNKDVFDQAAQSRYSTFTSDTISFIGNIANLIKEPTVGISAIAATATATGDSAYAGSFTTIEGIVTIPSDYAFAIGTEGCLQVNTVYARSFVLQDATAGILIAYGQEPPTQNISQSTSMKYINNARNGSMAVLGDRLRITVTRVQNYGSGANVVPVVTDFSNPIVVSSRNSVPYVSQSSAFIRNTDPVLGDFLKVRRVEGYVKTSPSNKECNSSDQREFQFDYQRGYMGVLCIGATSASDAASCTGSNIPINFQLSYNLGAGTLSGFDTGNSFSYNIAVGAKVRLTGPIVTPMVSGTAANLTLMLSQKVQVETLK